MKLTSEYNSDNLQAIKDKIEEHGEITYGWLNSDEGQMWLSNIDATAFKNDNTRIYTTEEYYRIKPWIYPVAIDLESEKVWYIKTEDNIDIIPGTTNIVVTIKSSKLITSSYLTTNVSLHDHDCISANTRIPVFLKGNVLVVPFIPDTLDAFCSVGNRWYYLPSEEHRTMLSNNTLVLTTEEWEKSDLINNEHINNMASLYVKAKGE